jgi:hypothetical protein
MTNWQRAMIGLRRASKTERRSMSKIRGHIDSIRDVKPSSGSRIQQSAVGGTNGSIRGSPGLYGEARPMIRPCHERIMNLFAEIC